jgi:hypothetical protein
MERGRVSTDAHWHAQTLQLSREHMLTDIFTDTWMLTIVASLTQPLIYDMHFALKISGYNSMVLYFLEFKCPHVSYHVLL